MEASYNCYHCGIHETDESLYFMDELPPGFHGNFDLIVCGDCLLERYGIGDDHELVGAHTGASDVSIDSYEVPAG